MPKLSRPKRRWRVLAIAATVAAALLTAAWGASVWWQRTWEVSPPGGNPKAVHLGQGSLVVAVVARELPDGPESIDFVGRDAGVIWRPKWAIGLGRVHLVAFPLWIPAAACALAAATLWRIDTRHRRRFRAGLCRACTYDRTGLPVAAACPECGEAPAYAAAASR